VTFTSSYCTLVLRWLSRYFGSSLLETIQKDGWDVSFLTGYKSSSCSSLCLSNFTAVQLHCCPLSWLSPNFRGLSLYLRGCPLLAYLSSFMTVLKLPSCSPINWLSATAREPLKVFFLLDSSLHHSAGGVYKNCQLGHISWKVLIGTGTEVPLYVTFLHDCSFKGLGSLP
jgi:hypothetical protein